MLVYRKGSDFVGEILGAFLMVLFGCGSVLVSTLFESSMTLVEIALVWGIGVTLAIFLSRQLSNAHLNPAVTIAMVLAKRMKANMIVTYISAQLMGAFLAGLTLYLLFSSSIAHFEATHEIVRGSQESIKTARMFGEFYAYPEGVASVSMPVAIAAEAFGTFLLVMMILALTEGCNLGRPGNPITPIFIGLTVTSIICLIAPLTQAGLNPARDFSPRMVAWIFGWDEAAFPDAKGGFFWVYIFAPILGASLASLFFLKVKEPLRLGKEGSCCTIK